MSYFLAVERAALGLDGSAGARPRSRFEAEWDEIEEGLPSEEIEGATVPVVTAGTPGIMQPEAVSGPASAAAAEPPMFAAPTSATIAAPALPAAPDVSGEPRLAPMERVADPVARTETVVRIETTSVPAVAQPPQVTATATVSARQDLRGTDRIVELVASAPHGPEAAPAAATQPVEAHQVEATPPFLAAVETAEADLDVAASADPIAPTQPIVIEIGRIEVRIESGATAPAPASVRRPANSAPQLADYLRSRQ